MTPFQKVVGQEYTTEPLRVSAVTFKNKVGFAKFEGSDQVFRFWLTAEFPVKLEVGAEAALTYEAKESNYQGQATIELWVTGFGGAPAAKVKGGGKTFAPKSAAEIHAAPVAAIIAAYLTSGLALPELTGVLDTYKKTMRELAGG